MSYYYVIRYVLLLRNKVIKTSSKKTYDFIHTFIFAKATDVSVEF
jgi:hypothetical protein